MTVAGLILVFILGLSILGAVSKGFSKLELLGLAFPMGMGCLTLAMFAFEVSGITINIYYLLLLTAVLVLLLNRKWILNPNSIPQSIQSLTINRDAINAVWVSCFAIVVYILYIITAKSLFWPTFATDAIGSFDLFAKAIAHEGKIINSLILDRNVGWGSAYPPLYSLSLAYAHMLGFESSKIIPALMYISLAISFYALLRQHVSPTNAIFATFLMVITPELLAQSAINITNVPHAVYASMAIIALYTWLRNKQQRYFYLSAILMGLNGWIRTEGIVFILSSVILLILVSTKNKRFEDVIIYACVAGLPFIVWQLFLIANIDVMGYGIQVKLIMQPFWDYQKFSTIWSFSKFNLLSRTYFGITVYLFVVMLLLNIKNLVVHKDKLTFLFVIVLAWLGYVILLYQLDYRRGMEELTLILSHSYKRFLFCFIVLLWFYISANRISDSVFRKIERVLGYQQAGTAIKAHS